VADWNNNAIRKIAMPGAVVTTLAGTAGDQVAVTGHADGLGSAASFMILKVLLSTAMVTSMWLTN